jgi:hypothetical protein
VYRFIVRLLDLDHGCELFTRFRQNDVPTFSESTTPASFFEVYNFLMCRSIKVLRRPAEPVTPDEIVAASRQFVRKVSGFHKPSQANQPAFEAAVQEIAAATTRLLRSLPEPRAVARPTPELTQP